MIKKNSVLLLISFSFVSFFVWPMQGQSSELDCNMCEDRAWASAEYLIWKIKESPEPVPLVVELPAVGTPKTVLGGRDIDTGWHSGGRFTLGYWFDCLGVEANYFFLGERSKTFTVTSDADGSPTLRVPFFNVTTGLEDSSPLATPGLYQGTAVLKLRNWMQGAELNLLMPLIPYDSSMSIGLLAGFRYWNFEEHLKFFANSPIISPPSVYNYFDKFSVQNNFFGGQIGASIDYRYCDFLLQIKGKLALGALCQRALINGIFNTNEFTGTVESFPGGFFALPTNIGHHTKTSFSVLPQVDVNLGYEIRDGFLLQLGYSFLYASNVLYAGNQIDPKINPTQSANIDFTPTPALVGEPSPLTKLKTTGLWAQGFNIGLIWQF